ncbi:predicted protein [Naegleria gruberi]|uniref:Predicted protein n=1 Tax=Naegleria gruberi TaxID=5762 RepID=D2UYL7_NAEGR|nr:uncharacterized protein NAEGRDRAFT_45208 [Naegleria gruberi]EFC50818.1 predicted protein [Naegleria gruberi]|eukprot:XP_002683562.1 predicted protein [Naegleria gruberi strain NEG-M]
MQNTPTLRKRNQIEDLHSSEEHHHDHHHHHQEHSDRKLIQRAQREGPSFLISCCTNLSYVIVLVSVLLGLFITNEEFSFIKEETRKLDFTRVYNEKLPSNQGYNLLFVHGAFGGKEEWLVNYFPYFQKIENPNIKSLGAFSMTGHGQSSHSEYIKWLRLHDYVKDLKTIIDNNYKGEKVILVCHSLGGLVCQKYLESLASKNDQSVIIRSVILLGSIPPIHRFDNILPSLLYDPSIALDMVLTQRLDPLVTKTTKHTKHFLYHEKTSESQIEEISKQVPLYPESIIYYLDALTCSLNPTPIMEYFSKRRFNIMVLGIEKDTFFSVGQFEKIVEFWKLILDSKPHHQVHSVLIPNSVQVGHNMVLDVEWKFVANKLNDFILELHE